MSPETAKFIPKFIEAVEAGHITLFAKKYPRCCDDGCFRCIFSCVCEVFTDANNHGKWNTSYRQFIKPYINHKKSSIEDFKLKYPELFI